MRISANGIANKFIIHHKSKKCCIFDLDGTIIFNAQFLSKENEALLLKIKAAGHELIFATGRSWRDFKLVMPKWAHEHFLVLFNGSLSIHAENIKHSQSISPNIVHKIIDICVDNHYTFVIDNLSHFYTPIKEH